MTPVSVLAFDLDHFKSINDRWGHAVGDSVLQLFATVVRKTMRADDVIGRVGGEEFVAILPGKLGGCCRCCRARTRRLRSGRAPKLDGRPIAATISAGVACGSPLATVDALIAAADAALYRAKANGRNRVEAGDVAIAAAPERLEEPAAGGQAGNFGAVATPRRILKRQANRTSLKPAKRSTTKEKGRRRNGALNRCIA